MATRKQSESDPVQPDEVHDGVESLSNWEFVDRTPTTAELLALLGTLKPLHGVEWTEIAQFVQGIPSSMKVTSRDDQGRKVTGFKDVIRLYVSVAGRLQMANLAADVNEWRIDFVPEPVTPTGVPGFLQMDERLVYREYVEIWSLGHDRLLGRRPGMAWVPASGGQQAAGSNPYEKVETAARGRALAAWGFGVLPGSGIASLEEMSGSRAPAPTQQSQEPSTRADRDTLVERALFLVEQVRQGRGKTQEQMFSEVDGYAKKTFGKSLAGEVDDTGAVTVLAFDALRDGQIQLLINGLQQTLQTIRAEEPAL